jgi:uncharacterized iron-regulated membrane protein
MTRRALRVAHRWLGLLLALPLLVQGLTGGILAVTPLWDALRPTPAVSVGAPRPASAILAAAAMPGLVAVRYGPPEPGTAAMVDLAQAGQRMAELQVLVDPASLAILGTRRPSVAYRWVHSLHENLLLPTMPGRSIVGWFGVGLLLLGLSGLVLWWPAATGRWWAAMRVTNRARGMRLQRELHGAAGFWACAMLVVMSVGGVSLAFPVTIRSMLAVPGAAPTGGGASQPLDIDAVLARAMAAVPGGVVTDVRLPSPPGRPVLVRLRLVDCVPGSPPAAANIDAAGSRVISLQDPRTQTLAARSLGWLRALHFGDAFGPVWRVLVVLTGLALPLLAITGTTLWMLRRRTRLRLAVQRDQALQGAAE